MKLLEQVDLVARRLRLSQLTIDAYSAWIRQYLRFSSARLGAWTHPAMLGTADCEAFLNDLVLRRRLSASSQNQALNALVFLYRHVLENTLPQDHLGKFALLRSRRISRVPTVLSADEVRRVIQAIDPARMSRLMVELMYGTGMRVSEVCTLRVFAPFVSLRVHSWTGSSRQWAVGSSCLRGEWNANNGTHVDSTLAGRHCFTPAALRSTLTVLPSAGRSSSHPARRGGVRTERNIALARERIDRIDAALFSDPVHPVHRC